MIAITELTQKINDGLNALATASDFPFVFAIQSEAGEEKPPERIINDVTVYINGITRIVDSDIIPAQATSVSTQTVQLEIAYPLPDDVEPLGKAIEPVRDILDNYFRETWIQTVLDTSGKEFMVAMYATIPTTGEIALTTGPGMMCTFSCYLYYNFVQDGLNSYSFVISFEGAQVPYLDAKITRVPVMSANPYSDTEGVAESLQESSALNIEFTAPTLQSEGNALFTAYKEFLLTGQNPANDVTITYEGTPHMYRMIFGQSSLALEGVKNGYTAISLVQAREV